VYFATYANLVSFVAELLRSWHLLIPNIQKICNFALV